MSGNIHSGVQDILLPPGVSEFIKKTTTTPSSSSLSDNNELKRDDDIENLIKTSSHFTNLNNLGASTQEVSLCCDICNIRVTSAKILQRHLEGRRHKSRAERRGKTFHCDLCDVTANSEIQLNIHLSSSRHKSRVAREEYKEFTSMSSYSTSIYILLFCIFCIVLNVIILVKVAF